MNKSKPYYSLKRFSQMIAISLSFSVIACSAQENQENPWGSSATGINRTEPISTEKNKWRLEHKVESVVDESKYPPFDENEALGLEIVETPIPGEYDQSSISINDAGGDLFYYPQSQDFEQVPDYTDLNRQTYTQHYSQNRKPNGARLNTQQGSFPFMPQRNYGSQSFMPGGFPFSGNSNSGNNNSGMPFGLNNSWMPFSNTGFW